MNYKKINTFMMLIAILILIVVFFIYTRSFTNNVPSCDGYLVNVFLYILLGLLLTSFSVLFIAKRKFPITFTKSLIAFAVAMIAIFAMYAINPEQVLLNHAVWLLFIIAISVNVYVIWRYSVWGDTINSTLVATVSLVIGLVSIAYLKPEWISLSWGSALTIILAAGILAWLIPLLLGTQMTNYYKGLSAVFIVIFMALILYDTKLLKVKAEKCIIPNYPVDSLGLFLDIINLFSNITTLRS